MSIQADCEMLSIEVMEAYARKYKLTGNDAAKLFHKNQVFENITAVILEKDFIQQSYELNLRNGHIDFL